MHTTRRHARAGAAVLAGMLALTACADDADDAAAPGAPASPEPVATVEEFCAAKLAIDAAFLTGGPPEEEGATPLPEQIGAELEETYAALYERLDDTAPEAEAVADAVEVLDERLEIAIEDGDEEFFLGDAFAEAEATVDEYLVENCGYQELSATAADHEFNDLPTRIEPGPTAVSLTNEGEEFHEILLFRINDDVDLSVEQLLALPEEEVMSQIAPPSAVTLVVPDRTATSFAELEEGRYAVVCFIGLESTAENDFNGDGLPHFTEGMFEELIVGDVEGASPQPTSTSDTSSSGGSAAGSTSEPTSESTTESTTEPTTEPTSAP